ncbi:HvfC/BufC family peptide modification chaperone [Endozoicomonas numazuensis]|uniref:Putative DNA-binding domain-containing protein n=1 Tax=Endozoicomonas numazuensis TaxID=1137799 RepID=A0A081NHI9_9GAMM|nr:putative DNA-binding domain-containing protein [Endozoicomonas numazuensis]KEQ17912.1 hypothetical protein GZ78_09775 [Endozoicomonas numazuensis]
MLTAPPTLKQNIETLTRTIRSQGIQSIPGKNISSRYYREFVRGNIKEVVQHSFPKFCSCIDEETMDSLANGFLKNHKTIEPEFHHIATEFVRFIQAHFSENPVLLSMLEYEWVLFCIEIDSQTVTNLDRTLSSELISDLDLTLTLNPTLQYIKLPFSLDEPFDCKASVKRGDFYYVLFRNKRHQILQKSLGELDHYFLTRISEHNGEPTSIIQQACTDKNKRDFMEWLQHSIQTDLIICS